MSENTKPKATAMAKGQTLVVSKNAANTIQPNARELEDDYVSYYESGAEHGLIRPPYDPKRLYQLTEQSNTLRPCISAMVTSIDGTGYEIERRDGQKMEDADDNTVQPAHEFFEECAPMLSFRTLRQRVRRDAESIGWGCMEVVRNPRNEVVFCGYLEAKMMRIGRLDNPVQVAVKMKRGGKEQTFIHWRRERRFAQKVGEQLIWFAEYGASRQLDKFTGQWAENGQVVPIMRRATEVLYFGVEPDITTPYHVPRWITQVPSVIGQRKAEEFNLEYFTSGGIPPYLLIVTGGQLAEQTVEALRNALNEKGAQARIQLVEAYATGGALDGSGGNVQVKVERFGGDRTGDQMFAEYDEDCEARIRKAFRLPPIMIGKSEDYNFASAHASYLVAEAQVFQPERDEFDEIITSTLLPELLGGSKDYVFRSKPISIVDASTQLDAISRALSTNRVDQEHAVTLLGEIAGLDFQIIDLESVPEAKDFERDPMGNVVRIEQARENRKERVGKSEDDHEDLDLISTTIRVMRMMDKAE